MTLWRPMLDGGWSPGDTGFEEPGGLIVGLEFSITSVDDPLWCLGIRYWQPSSGVVEETNRICALFTVSDTTAQVGASGTPTGPGWNSLVFATPYPLEVRAYKAVVVHTTGGYPASPNFFGGGGPVASNVDDGPVRLLSSANTANGNNTFASGNSVGYPVTSFNDSNYWVDVIVADDPEADPDPAPAEPDWVWQVAVTQGV